MNNIDVVYTWVDSSDIEWQNERNFWWAKNPDGDNCNTRFPICSDSSIEIRISIYSVMKYANWVNKIYIVTKRPQKPNIEYNDKIIIVYHDEIWNNLNTLPVFNSHAIEANLHRIKNLSEKFLYLCDDVFFCNYVFPHNFFRNNKPLIYGFDIPPNINTNSPYSMSHNNLHKIMKNKYLRPYHHAFPITKTIMQKAEIYFGNFWNNTIKNKFRNNDDIPPITSAISHANMTRNIFRFNRHVNMQYALYTKVEDFINAEKKNSYKKHCVCINNSNEGVEEWEKFLDVIKNYNTCKISKKNNFYIGHKFVMGKNFHVEKKPFIKKTTNLMENFFPKKKFIVREHIEKKNKKNNMTQSNIIIKKNVIRNKFVKKYTIIQRNNIQ